MSREMAQNRVRSRKTNQQVQAELYAFLDSLYMYGIGMYFRIMFQLGLGLVITGLILIFLAYTFCPMQVQAIVRHFSR